MAEILQRIQVKKTIWFAGSADCIFIFCPSFTSVPDPCHLCEALQSESWQVSRVYDHMYEWFMLGSRCIFTK